MGVILWLGETYANPKAWSSPNSALHNFLVLDKFCLSIISSEFQRGSYVNSETTFRELSVKVEYNVCIAKKSKKRTHIILRSTLLQTLTSYCTRYIRYITISNH